MPTDTRESTSSCSASWSLRLQLQPVIKLPTDTMEDAPAAPAAAAAVPTRRVTGTMIGAGSLVGQQVAVVGKVSNQTGTSVELVSAVRVVASYVRAPWWSGLWPLVWCVCGWRTLTHCWLCVAGRLACARGVGFRSQPVQVRGFSCCCSPTPCVLPHACAHWRVCRVAAPCSAFVEIVGTVRADGTVVEVRRAAFGDSFGALARAHMHGCMVESSRVMRRRHGHLQRVLGTRQRQVQLAVRVRSVLVALRPKSIHSRLDCHTSAMSVMRAHMPSSCCNRGASVG